MEATKRCTKCERDKPPAEFGPHPRTADKLSSWCRECKARDMKARRQRERERRERIETARRERDAKTERSA